jgi:hypothetical protein
VATRQWRDFETTLESPAGWAALPQTAWGVMFAWVAGPEFVRVTVSGTPIFAETDRWALESILEMLAEADVPPPIWSGWKFYYDGDFESSSYRVHEAIPPKVPVTPAMMIDAMRSTRTQWS